MQKELEKKFKSFISAGNAQHESLYKAREKGVISTSDYNLLMKAIRANNYTTSTVLKAGKYAGVAEVSFKTGA